MRRNRLGREFVYMHCCVKIAFPSQPSHGRLPGILRGLASRKSDRARETVETKAMGNRQVREANPVARTPDRVAPGSRPYLRVAETAYMISAALAVISLVLLAATFGSPYNTTVSDVTSLAIAPFLSVAWIQVGRKQGKSWFVAAGALGWVSPVLVLALRLEPSSSSLAQDLALAGFLSSDLYFVAQILAFNLAGNSFQVRPFKYATDLLAAGFVASLVGGSLAGALFATQRTGEWGPNVVYAIGLVFGVAVALAAAVGFRRLRGLPA